MSQVFISYRQTNDEQRERVRAFGERLRGCDGIDVVLDQFFLDANPGGPSDGFDKWSSDRALQTENVIIIGTREWFQCYEKTQPPGTGLGAACEADDVRHRLYRAGGVNDDIRIVLFDEADAPHIPAKLSRYRYFHAERDFPDIVRWLGGTIPSAASDSPRTSIPHNLPSLQPFFGREEELRKIANALRPESRTWGALIDGVGGIGKTSLAVRAAYDASPDQFDKIVFVSLKPRELDDDGVRDLSGFLISGLAELLNELARQLGHPDITKAAEDQRPRLLLDGLQGTRTLLVLDNLESLLKRERDVVFTFVKRLPPGCKAILTARGRIGSTTEELILEKLSEPAALATLAALAENNPALAKTRKEERLLLYQETGGSPLLLRWTAGQIGRGNCLTIADAIAFLRSCPDGNDPLEFIFGDLVDQLSKVETRILGLLSHFTLPAETKHVVEFAECSESESDSALRILSNRSLILPSEELKTFILVPLVGDFMRNKKADVVDEMGDRLEKRVYALVIENRSPDRFFVLDEAWPIVAAALRQILEGDNDRLQIFCNAVGEFLNFTGRWDEWFALVREAEKRAVAATDFYFAGWRAFEVGWICRLRVQAADVLANADRAAAHWSNAEVGPRERAIAVHLRGLGHKLAENFPSAIGDFREALDLFRTLGTESQDVAIALNDLADTELLSGDLEAAERDHLEGLRIAKAFNYHEGVAYITSNLASVALARGDWSAAEALTRDSLALSQEVGRLELIAADCHRLAEALMRQGKKTEALPYARRAVEIFGHLGSPNLAASLNILGECEN